MCQAHACCSIYTLLSIDHTNAARKELGTLLTDEETKTKNIVQMISMLLLLSIV